MHSWCWNIFTLLYHCNNWLHIQVSYFSQEPTKILSHPIIPHGSLSPKLFPIKHMNYSVSLPVLYHVSLANYHSYFICIYFSCSSPLFKTRLLSYLCGLKSVVNIEVVIKNERMNIQHAHFCVLSYVIWTTETMITNSDDDNVQLTLKCFYMPGTLC